MSVPGVRSPLPPSKPKLLDQVRQTIRRKHYSIRTEEAYVDWIKRYIFFHKKRHPAEMSEREIEQFLNHLAVQKQVAASTQNQALSALIFLYREVLGKEIGWMENLERAKQPERLPIVLTETEAHHVLAHLEGRNWLMASLLYSAGLRLMDFHPIRAARLGTPGASGCASKMLTLNTIKSRCAMARDRKTGSQCCRSRPLSYSSTNLTRPGFSTGTI
jgi:integrase